MTLAELQLLFDYHYWARDRVLDAAAALDPDAFTRDLGSSFRSVRDTLAHTYGAEWIWHARWTGESPAALPSGDQFPDLATLRRVWVAHEGRVRALLAARGEAGVDQVIEYRLLSGQPGASAFWQMAQHVVNHATYHRGQVVTMLRQLGVPPPRPTDLIAFYRERG